MFVVFSPHLISGLWILKFKLLHCENGKSHIMRIYPACVIVTARSFQIRTLNYKPSLSFINSVNSLSSLMPFLIPMQTPNTSQCRKLSDAFRSPSVNSVEENHVVLFDLKPYQPYFILKGIIFFLSFCQPRWRETGILGLDLVQPMLALLILFVVVLPPICQSSPQTLLLQVIQC